MLFVPGMPGIDQQEVCRERKGVDWGLGGEGTTVLKVIRRGERFEILCKWVSVNFLKTAGLLDRINLKKLQITFR